MIAPGIGGEFLPFGRDIHEAAKLVVDVGLPVVAGFVFHHEDGLIFGVHIFHEAFGIRTVQVHGPEVGLHVVITAGFVAGTGRVDALGQVIDGGHQSAVSVNVAETPGFVGGGPGDDGGVVEVPFHDLTPFRHEVPRTLPEGLVAAAHGGVAAEAVETPAGAFAPGEIAQFVRPVVEAFFKDFLVETGAVESGSHGKFDVFLECFIGGGSPDAVRIEALIQHETQEDGLVVQVNFAVFGVDLAQTGIGADGIHHHAVGIDQFVCNVIEERIFRAPGADVLAQFHGEGHGAVGRHGFFRDFLPVRLDGHAQCAILTFHEKFRREVEGFCIQIRHDLAVFQPVHRHGFHPDGLPDPGSSGVEAAHALVGIALFAVGLHGAALIVFNGKHQIMFAAGFHKFGNIKGKGAGAAVVDKTRFLAVDKRFAAVINPTEMEQDPFALPIGRDRQFLVVEHGFNEVLVPHAGEIAFRAERNGDLVLESGVALPDLAVSAALSEVEFIGPGAVQVDPVFTDKLRARVLTSRDFCTHCFFSLIFKV